MSNAMPLKKKNIEDYIPSEQEVREYAENIGINPDAEPELMWLAGKGIVCPLLPGWKAYQNKSGDVFYFNASANESTWEHPVDTMYRRLVIQERERSKKAEGKKEATRKMQKCSTPPKTLPPLKTSPKGVSSSSSVLGSRQVENMLLNREEESNGKQGTHSTMKKPTLDRQKSKADHVIEALLNKLDFSSLGDTTESSSADSLTDNRKNAGMTKIHKVDHEVEGEVLQSQVSSPWDTPETSLNDDSLNKANDRAQQGQNHSLATPSPPSYPESVRQGSPKTSKGSSGHSKASELPNRSKENQTIERQKHMVNPEVDIGEATSEEDLYTFSWDSSELPPNADTLNTAKKSPVNSRRQSGQDSQLSKKSTKNETFKRQKTVVSHEIKKEASLEKKSKNNEVHDDLLREVREDKIQAALRRQEEEEERFLKAESEERLRALRQSLLTKRKEEEARLIEESEKALEDLRGSLQASQEKEEQQLRQKNKAILKDLQSQLKQELERKKEELKLKNKQELENLETFKADHKDQMEQLKKIHQKEIDIIKEKHQHEAALLREQLMANLEKDREHIEASHSVELDKLKLELKQHLVQTEKMQLENKKSQRKDLSEGGKLSGSDRTSLQSKDKNLVTKTKHLATEDKAELHKFIKEERYKAQTTKTQLREECERAREEQRRSREERDLLEPWVKLLHEREHKFEARAPHMDPSCRNPGSVGACAVLTEDLETSPSPAAAHNFINNDMKYVSSHPDPIQKAKLFLENHRRSQFEQDVCSSRPMTSADLSSSSWRPTFIGKAMEHSTWTTTPFTVSCQSRWSSSSWQSATHLDSQRLQKDINSLKRWLENQRRNAPLFY